MVLAAQRAKGDDAGLGVLVLQFTFDLLDADGPELREQPDGAGADVGILVLEQFANGLEGLVTHCDQREAGGSTDIHRRALQRGDGSIDRGVVHLGNLGLKTLRRDAVDRAGKGLVPIRMAADARIEPVRHVDRAIGSDGHVRRTEEGLQLLGFVAAALEIGAGELALLVGGEEVEALQLEARTIGHGLVAEDGVAAGFAAEEKSARVLAEGAVLVKGDARRRTAAVDVAGGHGAGIFLTPLGGGSALAGTTVRAPGTFAVGRAEAGVAVFQQERRPARRGIVVVVLEDVAEGRDGLLVAVAEVVADDLHGRAVGIHARRETADPDVAVVALLAGDLRWFPAEVGLAGIVGAADAEGLARLVGEHRAAVAAVEIILAVRSHGDAVDGVVVDAGIEAVEQHLALVDGGIELHVPVHVGVDDDVRRHGDDDLVVDHRHAHRGEEERLLHEGPGLVGLAVAVGVLHHDDAVALGLALGMAAVVHALGDPEATVLVEVEVRRVLQHRRRGEDGDFQLGIGGLEQARRHDGVGGLQSAEGAERGAGEECERFHVW